MTPDLFELFLKVTPDLFDLFLKVTPDQSRTASALASSSHAHSAGAR